VVATTRAAGLVWLVGSKRANDEGGRKLGGGKTKARENWGVGGGLPLLCFLSRGVINKCNQKKGTSPNDLEIKLQHNNPTLESRRLH